MPDTVERTIYELVLDDQGFIRAVDGANASLQKLIQTQNAQAQALRTNEAALKAASDRLAQVKKDLEAYTGTNADYRAQLEKDVASAQTDQQKLTDLVKENQAAYEAATKAARDYVDTAERAAGIAGPTGVVQPPGAVPALPSQTVTPIATNITQAIAGIGAEDIAGAAQASTDQFKLLAEAVEEVEKAMIGLNTESVEFKQLEVIADAGRQVMQALTETANGTYASFQKIPGILADMQTKLAALAPASAPLTDIQEKIQAFGSGVAAFKPPKIIDESQISFVKQLTTGTQEFSAETETLSQHQISLRQQILNNNNELARLFELGKEDTEQYKALEIETAKLNQLYREQRERIAVLSSETRGLNFGKAAIQSAISSYQTFTAIQILAGNESEKLQKKTMQLFAAMQLLSSIEQITTQLKRGGTIATELETAAMAAYKFVVDATSTSLKVFRGALLATGIGAAVAAIALIVTKFQEMHEAAQKANEENKRMQDLIEKSGSAAGTAQAQLNKLTIEIKAAREGHLSAKDVLKEYNETIGQTVGHTNDLATAEKNLIELGPDYIKLIQLKAQAEAAGALAVEASKKQLQDEQKTANSFVGFWERLITNDPVKQRANAKKKALDEDAKNTDYWFNKQKEITQQAIDFANQHKLNFIPKPDPKPDTKQIENVFEQEQAALLEKLSELRRNEQVSIQKINDEYVAKLQTEKLRIAKLLKEKKITEVQAEILVNLAVKINQVQLDKAIADFQKQVNDARQKLNDAIAQGQTQTTINQAGLIQDEFQRRKVQLDLNEKKEIDDRTKADRDMIEKLREDRRKGIITNDTDLQTEEMKVITNGVEAINFIIEKYGQERQKLAVDIFEKTLKGYEDAFNASQLTESETNANIIRELSNRFISGKISYENYQKELSVIQSQAADQRRNDELKYLEQQLTDLDNYIASYTDKNSNFYKELIKQRDALRGTIAQKRTEDAIADANQQKKDNDAAKTKIQQLQKYAESINGVAQQVGQFWTSVNEFEQKSLDRSIQLQQTRVDQAQKIADRGNASYLKSEQDRLQQLQVQRENAARRQMGVDAALQASQILTGITGAIAKISTGIGAAEAIAEVATIVGLLATGYTLVKTLQTNQPKLKGGTKYLKRDGQPAGIDTIPVMANEGEAVIPTEINRVYHPAVSAIYDQKIPPEIVNKFVHNYVNNRDQNVENVESARSWNWDFEAVKNYINSSEQGLQNVRKYLSNRGISSMQKQETINVFNQASENVKSLDQNVVRGVKSLDQSFENVKTYIDKSDENAQSVMAYVNKKMASMYVQLKKESAENIQSRSSASSVIRWADSLNNFTSTYNQIRPVHSTNWTRIKEAADIHVASDSRLQKVMTEQNKLLIENNDLQRQIFRALKSMGVNVNVDKNGLAVSVLEVMDQIEKDRRT